MSTYFVDSSALVKRYREEAGSAQFSSLLESADRIIISRLAHAEVSAAIARRGRNAGIPADQLSETYDQIDSEMRNSFDVVELTESVVSQAAMLSRKHAMRAADAVQLSCALAAAVEFSGEELRFVSSDVALNSAASGEGLLIVDPTTL